MTYVTDKTTEMEMQTMAQDLKSDPHLLILKPFVENDGFQG